MSVDLKLKNILNKIKIHTIGGSKTYTYGRFERTHRSG